MNRRVLFFFRKGNGQPGRSRSVAAAPKIMKLHEYQSKHLFSRYDIPIPRGSVADTAEEARHITAELGGRVVVKAQVLVGGRGKAGGIRLAKSPDEASDLARQILAMKIKGLPVRRVLLDEAVNIQKEIYLGITNDRSIRRPVMMISAAGGVDIEEVARLTPEKIVKTVIDPLIGLREYQARDMAVAIDLPQDLWRSFTQISAGLWRAYLENDATLAEINPLVITGDHHLLALDGKMILDDNALYRHAELAALRDVDEETAAETEARKNSLSYIQLDGQIGCMVNGAGLAMATMDIIKLYGGQPANFLDIGGGASAEKVSAAFQIILSDVNVRAILINIFGGITRCDEVANGILQAIRKARPRTPMVVRLVGTNATEGRRILAEANMITAETLVEAAQKVVALAGEVRT